MKTPKLPSGCACCNLNRRQFLERCAACVGAAYLGGGGLLGVPTHLRASLQNAAQDSTGGPVQGAKPRIRIIYSLHGPKQEVPDWPNKGFDFVPVMDRIQQELARQCPGFEFVTSLADGPEQAQAILDKDSAAAIDGYLVYQMNCWNKVVQTILSSGKPVLYADFQFAGSGGFLVYTAGFLRDEVPNLGFVASSRIEDVAAAVKCFDVVKRGGSVADFVAETTQARVRRTPKPGPLSCRPDDLKPLPVEECLRRLQESKILAVKDTETGPAAPLMGIPVQHVSFAEVNEAWTSADKEQVRDVADFWQKSAAAVIDVSRETLESSAAMYLGMKAVMKKHSANAITVNCLGGFYGGHIHAYPCLGFHQLNNEGLVGGCECDVRSTATMVLETILTHGRPGFISDPVIDTAKRQIIYAHCVASNKAFGPEGEANPFTIMTHSEDRQGASVRSILPLGYMTTTLDISQDRKEIIFHQAKAVANDPDDRACRTKLCAEPVGDIEKLFTMWDQWSWHRVTCYGDLKEPVFALADAMGWKVIQEA
ncbi:MAG: hypothetical protein AB1486_28205 [Planctomycetota bacterium]